MVIQLRRWLEYDKLHGSGPGQGDRVIRERLNETLKAAMLAKDARKVSTVRLILAALKDRDIAARPRGLAEGIPEEEVLQLLQSMIKQRRESIGLYRQGGRPELAEQEEQEIAVIASFLPAQLSEAEVTDAVEAAICGCGAQGLKDMGRVMASLRERFAGRMDFSKASALVKQKLA